MNFNEYQKKALETATYPDLGHNLIYPALGMAGESGEVADKVKKNWRNLNATAAIDLTSEQRKELMKEIGDVLWYISALSWELGYDLEEVAQTNIDKLLDRRARGVIKSEGDNR